MDRLADRIGETVARRHAEKLDDVLVTLHTLEEAVEGVTRQVTDIAGKVGVHEGQLKLILSDLTTVQSGVGAAARRVEEVKTTSDAQAKTMAVTAGEAAGQALASFMADGVFLNTRQLFSWRSARWTAMGAAGTWSFFKWLLPVLNHVSDGLTTALKKALGIHFGIDG
jgi:uncharacterized protein YoxC